MVIDTITFGPKFQPDVHNNRLPKTLATPLCNVSFEYLGHI